MGPCLSSETQQKAVKEVQNYNERAKTREKNSLNRFGGPVDFDFLRRGGLIGEADLHRISSRMLLSGASRVASLYTQRGTRAVNQDAMIVWEDFCSREDTVFCGVFDGHGQFGHLVSKKVRDSLPFKLCCLWKASFGEYIDRYACDSILRSMSSEETGSVSLDDEWSESLDVEESKKLPEKHMKLKQSLLKAFKLMDEELEVHPDIDCASSGTTTIALIKQGQELVIGNVGDSRAVLGTRDKDNAMVAIQLTVDFKPDLPREAARIQQRKGRIFDLRVWLPDEDGSGLNMTRAFGDFDVKEFGVISVPDITYSRLTERDEFIILATDGVWDVLSNKEAVDIVASTPCRGTAAKALVDSALKVWRTNFPTSKIDDCTAVCLFLNQSTTNR